MPNNPRVSNITRGHLLNFKQARKAVENCCATWVEYGVSIRDLSLAEAISARNEQARMRDPLPYVEVHGLRYEPPEGGKGAYMISRRLTWEAHVFSAKAIGIA